MATKAEPEMAWVRIDDAFYDHPKVLAAGDRAVGLAVRAIAYSAHHLTDGRITRPALKYLGGSTRDAGRLVDVGLWETNGRGWLIHDFADYQMTRDEIERRREDLSRKRSEAGRKGAQARWQKDGKDDDKLP